MSRKRRKTVSDAERSASSRAARSMSVLPMELQIGDRVLDQDFEWEVLTRPETLHGAKRLRARIQRPGLPESEREMTWPAHQHVEIRRGGSE